ncbi:MAG: hypothetical protein ABWY35_00155 [Pseudorhodoplanes sp.]
MILQITPERFEVLDKDDLRRLKLRAPSGSTASDIQRSLPFEAAIVEDYIWVRQSDLRELCSAVPQASGPNPFDEMINTARKYGFYDEDSGSVRVHIEFY